MGLETGTFISDLVDTNPVAGDNVSQGDDHLRLIKDVVQNTFPNADQAFYTSEDFADVASAGTCAIGGAASLAVNITGTTTITSFGTIGAGIWRFVKFAAALTLTHNGTSLVLPGGANITTAAGDTLIAFSRGAGNWTVLTYFRAAAAPLAFPITVAQGGTGQTTEAEAIGEMTQALTADTAPDYAADYVPTYDASADTGKKVLLSTLALNADNAIKAWGLVTVAGGTPTLAASFGVTSITDSGTGLLTVELSTPFASTAYAVIATVHSGASVLTNQGIKVSITDADTFTLRIETSDGTEQDPTAYSFACLGAQ